MALIDPSVSFDNAFNSAQNVTNTFRKNMAFKALEKTYGPIVGDMKLATDVQAYEHNELMNPLEVEQQSLSNESLRGTNAFNEQYRPMQLEQARINNETGQHNLDQSVMEADRAKTIQQARDAHSTLTGVLDTVEQNLNGVVDPNQRLQVFDDQVRQLAPLIGADADQLLHSLAQQRAAIAAQGTGAIGPLRQQLDDMLYAGLSPEERQKLETGELDQLLKMAQIGATDALTTQREAAAEKAATGGDGAATEEGITMAVDQLERTLDGIANLSDLADEMDDVGLARKAKSVVPGTAEYDFLQQAQSTAVEGGLQALQALDEAGVSLAPMSDTDFRALVASVANLDVGQSKGQIKAQVNNLLSQTKRALQILKKKREDLAAEQDEADDGAAVDYTTYFGAE